jgi:uncharacterized protein (TIGR03435 family)
MRNHGGRVDALIRATLFLAGFMTLSPVEPALGQLLHPSGTPLPSFEVATIKPDNDPQSRINFQISSGRFAARHFSLKDLIEFAYHSKTADQLMGGPGWKNTEFFNVEARVGDAETAAMRGASAEELMDQYRLMAQSLLADRFQLRVSFKTEPLPVYALIVSDGGYKMKDVTGNSTASGRPFPLVRLTGPDQFNGTDCTMTRIVDWLSHFDEVGNRLVVDETGLKGRYDFVLSGVTMGPAGVNASAPEENTTSIFTALREQLGLKLEPRKVPVEILVIDHVERPSPN